MPASTPGCACPVAPLAEQPSPRSFEPVPTVKWPRPRALDPQATDVGGYRLDFFRRLGAALVAQPGLSLGDAVPKARRRGASWQPTPSTVRVDALSWGLETMARTGGMLGGDYGKVCLGMDARRTLWAVKVLRLEGGGHDHKVPVTLSDVENEASMLHRFFSPDVSWAVDEGAKTASIRMPWGVLQLGQLWQGARRPKAQLMGALIMQAGRDVALQLEHMHSQGISHNDVKNNNIVMMPTGTFRLVDMGVCGSTLIPPQSTTLFYSAPELLAHSSDGASSPSERGHPGAQADIWSLGVTLLQAIWPVHACEDVAELAIGDVRTSLMWHTQLKLWLGAHVEDGAIRWGDDGVARAEMGPAMSRYLRGAWRRNAELTQLLLTRVLVVDPGARIHAGGLAQALSGLSPKDGPARAMVEGFARRCERQQQPEVRALACALALRIDDEVRGSPTSSASEAGG